jgi:RHS repeat-associated protein
MYRLKKATDETGSVVLTYNNQGLVKQVDGPMGKISSVVYDKEDREQTVVDRNGISTSRQFDPLDRIRSVTWPDTGVESWGYTAGFASPSSYTNQIGKVTSNLYDPLQRKTHEWVSGVYTNRFLYNPESSISQLIDGNGNVTRWGFDAYGRAIAKTNATGQLVWTNAFNANGWQTARWTPGKGLIRFGYDAAGNQVGITNPASPSIRFGYDALNRITNMVDGVGTTAFGFSSFGKLAFEDGPWTSDRINYGYDSVRRLSGVALQQPTGEWAQSFSYDNAGRMVGTVSPAGAFVYEYSILSGFAPNRISRLRLPNAGWIDNDYDSVGRRTGTRLLNSSSSVLNRHDYILDLAGNRKKVTLTSGNTWDYTYDDSGQLLTAVGKESGGVIRLHEQLQYRYDASGNLTNRTSDALQLYITANARNEISGTSRTGTLTVAGSVTAPASSVLVNGSAATRYADNSWAKSGNALANGVNTFTAVATQTGTGTQDTTVSTINIPTSPTFNYDANGNLIWDGLKSFTFDDQDQLVSIQQAGQWRSEFSYDGLRRRRVSKEYTWSGGSTSSLISNGALTASLRNDFTGFVGASITVGSSPVVVSELGRWKINGNSGSHLIKLVRASDSADVPGGAVTVNLTGGTVGTFVYGALPAPITLESFTTYYLICQEYLSGDTWYNENQPVVASTGLTINSAVWRNGSGVFFAAGSAGTSYGTLSLKGAVGSWNQTSETRYVYDGNLVVQERNSSNAPTISYTRGLDLGGGRQGVGGIGGLLAHTTHGSPSVSHYYHADASGNITALVNVQNQISARYSHDPYGNLIGISGPMADLNRYRFSSKEVHDRSGLYLYGYRFYDPQYQRWVNLDPLEEGGGFNLYRFVNGDPFGYVDPDGQMGMLAGGLIGGGLGAGLGAISGYFQGGLECALKGAIVGGVGGFVAGATFNSHLGTAAATIVGGLMGGFAMNWTDQALRKCHTFDEGELFRETINGAIYSMAGSIAGKGVGKLLDTLKNSLDDIAKVASAATTDIAQGTKLLGPGIQFSNKIESQLAKRGWTKDLVESTVSNPKRTIPWLDTRFDSGIGGRISEPATVYYSQRGGYVVRNNRTGEIVQISNRSDPNWRAPWDWN